MIWGMLMSQVVFQRAGINWGRMPLDGWCTDPLEPGNGEFERDVHESDQDTERDSLEGRENK